MTQRITLAIAAALAALLLSAGLVAAQDPPETATATRLEPGLNLVGWVGEPTPVSQLFREIPRLEAIWAWDAELRDWIVAAPNAPEWLGGLGRVTAGMGLRMQLGGDQSFVWQRSTEPTRGLVKLRTGWNLVAWSGADGAAIGDVVKGIGWSLRTVRRWDAAIQEWIVWTSPERSAQVIANTGADQDADSDAEMPGIRRGEALWIEVARAVNWLQPTEILPRLVFPGGASDELQARVREDLRATLSFFRDQYGIHADPDFTIYIPKDVDSLIQAYRDDGEEVDEAYEASGRALWNREGVVGWGGSDIVVKQPSWPEDLSTDEIAYARYTVTHEYYHVLQRQLRDSSRPTDWLVEGTASWVDDEHKVLDGEQTWDDLRADYSSAITDDAPGLRSTESDNARWEYTLGWLATDQLTANTAPDFPIEFWRQLTSTKIGPHLRWTSTPDWRTAFQVVYGRPVSEFYEVFDAWQREQAATNPATANSYDGNWLRGHVTDEGGTPVAGAFVNAIRVEGETSVGWNQRAETSDDGSFAVRAPENGSYHLSIDIADDCTGYYRDDEVVAEKEGAQPVRVDGADVNEIKLRMSGSVCGWHIRGQVVGPNDEPLAGISVTAYNSATDSSTQAALTAHDGSFAVQVPTPSEYRLELDLSNGCNVHYASKGSTFEQDRASLITVDDADVDGISIDVPAGMCVYQITGSVAQSNGQPLADTYMHACLEDHRGCVAWAGRYTDDDGAFTITVPTEGRYHIEFNLNDCRIYFRAGGLTTVYSERSTVRVEGRDARLSQIQIPERICANQIKGFITQADGQPLADTYVSACLEVDGDCVSWTGRNTDDDGAFAITVPTEGSYHLSFSLEGCTVYFSGDGLTTDWQTPYTVRVEGRSLRMNPRQIPAGMCAHRISGRFIDSSGAPLPETRIGAFGAGSLNFTRTDLGGRFEIRVPTAGAYTFGVHLRAQPYCFPNLVGRALGSPNNPVRVSGADVTGIVLRLPGTIEELCE